MVDLKRIGHATRQKIATKSARKMGFEAILHRFQSCEIYRSSQTNIRWAEEFSRRLNDLAQEDHPYLATRQERERYEHGWKMSLNSQGPVGPMWSRADSHATLRKVLDVKQEAAEAGHQFNPTGRSDLQVRQRGGQQFLQRKDCTTDHDTTEKCDLATSSADQTIAWSVVPRTGWIWWPSSTSWSSTSWWSSTGWQEW